jgi:hypothetical protein
LGDILSTRNIEKYRIYTIICILKIDSFVIFDLNDKKVSPAKQAGAQLYQVQAQLDLPAEVESI